jgi:lipopolysaccharide transport system ATP-binding protein
MTCPAVRVLHVSKRFRIGQSHDSLRDLIAAWGERLFGRRAGAKDSIFWAVKDLSFEVEPGEAVGIIGPNGAGKSTVLRLLAGILRPEAGEVSVRGRLAALIEVGAGFHGDLTGRENVFLNGAILGMTRREIRAKLDSIVTFAGIERFLDMPVKRYSSGMYARLGFSIAAHVDPDVLLVDEVLSVGDAVFRLRCIERMRELVETGCSLVFVTHNLEQMQSICRRAIVLEDGAPTFAGRSREAVGHYMNAMTRAYTGRPTDLVCGGGHTDGAAGQIDLRLLDRRGEEVVWVRPSQPLRAEVSFRLTRPISKLVVELNLRASVNENLLSFNSGRDGLVFQGHVGEHRVTLDIPGLRLSGGQYFWNVRMWDAERGTTEADTPLQFPMVIDDEGRATGSLALEHQWAFDAPAPGTRRDIQCAEGEVMAVEVGGGR